MPQRGEVWMVDLGMVAKVRPALVLSQPFTDADRALITVIPHTQSLRGSRFEIALSLPFLKSGAFLIQSPVTIPAVKAGRLLGRLTPAQLAMVESGVRGWLGL
jgi:mRNA interferase MazF